MNPKHRIKKSHFIIIMATALLLTVSSHSVCKREAAKTQKLFKKKTKKKLWYVTWSPPLSLISTGTSLGRHTLTHPDTPQNLKHNSCSILRVMTSTAAPATRNKCLVQSIKYLVKHRLRPSLFVSASPFPTIIITFCFSYYLGTRRCIYSQTAVFCVLVNDQPWSNYLGEFHFPTYISTSKGGNEERGGSGRFHFFWQMVKKVSNPRYKPYTL